MAPNNNTNIKGTDKTDNDISSEIFASQGQKYNRENV